MNVNISAYANMCFVIMPFGKREIDSQPYDFDSIYNNLFKLAIEMVPLPEGGNLVAKRADITKASGIITDEMFQDILYARIALVDITGLNPNVLYELGIRHALRPTTTVVFREEHVEVPFDVHDLRVFKYEIKDIHSWGSAVTTIKNCLEESLRKGEVDSPVVSALRDDLEWPKYYSQPKKYRMRSWLEVQRLGETVKEYLREASIRVDRRNLAGAIACCQGARALVPNSLEVNMRLASLLKDTERFQQAQGILRHVTKIYPDYAGAWRELGIVEHKLGKAPDAVPTLEKAVELNRYDPDAWSSLGGVYKTLQQYGKAQDAYKEALQLDPKSTYALLNYFTMKAVNTKSLPDLKDQEQQFRQAIETCEDQALNGINLPWCLYDLAQLRFLEGDMEAFYSALGRAINESTAKWYTETARKTYKFLKEAKLLEGSVDLAIEKFDELVTAKSW